MLTRDDTLEKRGLTSEQIRPRFAVMDPELTCSLPPYQIACGVVDIMMHTLDPVSYTHLHSSRWYSRRASSTHGSRR